MGIRSAFYGVVVSGALVAAGVQGVYTSISNPTPIEAVCADFNPAEQSGAWFRLSGCRIALDEAVYFYDEKHPEKIVELYVPVRKAEGSPARLVISSSDPKWIAAIQDMTNFAKLGDEKYVAWHEKHLNKLQFTADVSGLMKFGVDSDDLMRMEFTKHADTLAANYGVLAHNEEPSLGLGLLLSTLGLGGFGRMGLRAVRRRG